MMVLEKPFLCIDGRRNSTVLRWDPPFWPSSVPKCSWSHWLLNKLPGKIFHFNCTWCSTTVPFKQGHLCFPYKTERQFSRKGPAQGCSLHGSWRFLEATHQKERWRQRRVMVILKASHSQNHRNHKRRGTVSNRYTNSNRDSTTTHNRVSLLLLFKNLASSPIFITNIQWQFEIPNSICGGLKESDPYRKHHYQEVWVWRV